MGGTTSRSGAFKSMNEEQPLTPPTPHRDLSQPWPLPRQPSNQSLNENVPCDPVLEEGDLNAATVTTATAVEADRPEVDADTEGVDNGPLQSSVNGKLVQVDDLFAVTPVQTATKMDGKLSAGSEGHTKKRKLTSLLRTLSATATSSSARMTSKSGANRSLMVDMQATHCELAEEEAAIKVVEEEEPRPSPVLRMLNLARSSPYTPVTSSSTGASKYSPMNDE